MTSNSLICRLLFGWVIAWPLATCAQTIDVQIDTVDGGSKTGQLADLGAQSISLRIDGQNETTKLNFADLAAIRFSQPAATITAECQVNLVDGSQIMLDQFSLQQNRLTISGSAVGQAEISSRHIDSFQHRALNPALDDQAFKKVVAQPKSEDALLVARDGQLNAIEGVVKSIQSGRQWTGQVTFAVGDRTADVAISKLAGIALFHPQTTTFDQPLARMRLVDGSQLAIKELRYADRSVEIQLVCGIEWKLPLDQVSRLDFTRGQTIWLSDLTPTTNDWQPLLAGDRLVERLRAMNLARFKKGYDGHQLEYRVTDSAGRVTWQVAQHGIAIRGGSRLAFKLDGQFNRLIGKVGFAREPEFLGRVSLRISADGRSLFDRELANSENFLALPLELSVADCDRLLIEVDYADGRSAGDTLYLLEMVLQE